jgi:hypothetical protein
MARANVITDDLRDVPKCLRAVRLNAWREGPTGNGDSVCYGTFEQGTARAGDPQWFEVEPATGSDYSGGTVTLANQRELKRLLAECENPALPDCVWCTAYGGHDSYALFVVYKSLPEEIREVLGALDDYPSVDDEAVSDLECELARKPGQLGETPNSAGHWKRSSARGSNRWQTATCSSSFVWLANAWGTIGNSNRARRLTSTSLVRRAKCRPSSMLHQAA